RKETVQRLKESEEKYRSLITNIRDVVVEVDFEGRLSYVSPQIINLLGYTPGELHGVKFIEYVHPEDVSTVMEGMKRSAKLIEASSIECRIKHKEGRFVFVSAKGRMIRKKGKMKIVGVLRNISEKKDAEKRLKESEEKLKKFMESATDGFVIFDSKLNYIDVNEVSQKLVGRNKEELIGKNILDILPYLKETERYDKYLDVIKTGIPFSTEDVIYNRTDGSNSSRLSVRAFKVGDNLGIIFTDITERRKWEEVIINERNKAQSYLDLAGALIIALDKNGNISLINKKGCEVLGYLVEELIGKQWFKNFLPPRLSEPVFKDFKRLIRGELEPVEFYENPILTKNGEERIIAWHNSLLYDKEENIIGTLTSGEDITEGKKAEQKLQKSEKFVKSILNTVPSHIYIYDWEKNQNIYSAPHVKEMLGYSPEELSGLEGNVLPMILHPDDKDKFNEVIEKLMSAADNEIIEGEYRFRHKDGQWVHVFDRVMVFKRNTDGQVIQFLGCAIDITKRIEFEMKLKESEEKWRALSENSPAHITLFNRENKIIFINRIVPG
ncbi:hypothetical protein LCGC14_2355980, partial [marine sediment metagenome]